MNCADFDRWLDSGRLADETAAAHAHARDCRRCSGALEASLEFEAALASTPSAPAGFTDRVMARVAMAPQMAPSPDGLRVPRSAWIAPAMPWWTRAATDPAMVLALLLTGVVTGWGGALWAGVQQLGAGWQASAGTAPAFAWEALLRDPRIAFSVALAILPSLIWLCRRLYAWSETLVSRDRSLAGIRTT